MKRYLLLLLVFSISAFLAGCGASASQGEDGPEVFVADIEKTTGQGKSLTGKTVRYVERVISEAEDADAEAVALRLNTSGGRLDQTQELVETISNADNVPVIVYVAPQGAQAASAGTFILLAGDVAAMAPQTRTGAATPVSFFGQDLPSTLSQKARNDAVALITGLAEAHGRNEEWAESAVRDAAAISASEAEEIGVIEYVEPDLRAVLRAADGETVEPKGIELNTANATLVEQSLSFRERFGFSRWFAIIPTIVLVLALAGFGAFALRTSRWEVSTGREGMVGEVGVVRRPVAKDGGTVFVHGELWTALPEDPRITPLETGSEVEVVGFRRTAVVVRPAN